VEVIRWFNDPSRWWGAQGILHRLAEHVAYVGVAVAVATLGGLFVGILAGRARRPARSGRRLPMLIRVFGLGGLAGIVGALHPYRGWLVVILFGVLAIGPVAGSVADGFASVDTDALDAAEALGLSGRQRFLGIELRCALPAMVAGVRAAVVREVVIVAVGAYVGLAGLGRFVVDESRAGALSGMIMVAALAIVADLLGALVQRWLTPAGLRAALRSRR
jgi:osmoprotectant transport system permease protein